MANTERPPEPSPEVIPSLPNDIALNILARLPRRSHAVLSTVSKPFRSAVSCPDFFAARSLLNRSENILYLRVGSDRHTHDNWFAVHRNPNPNNNNLLQLAPVPSIPVETRMDGSAYAVVGPKIYVIGGHTDSVGPWDSSDVWVLDCRSHTWERGPSMRTPRSDAETVVMDGKVYVIGGSRRKLLVEVLDPALGRWEAVRGPLDVCAEGVSRFELVNGKISFRWGAEEFRLDPKTKKWDVLPVEDALSTPKKSLIDRVRCRSGGIEWFDKKTGKWKELKGAEKGKPTNALARTMLNLDRRLVVTFAEFRSGVTTDLKDGKYGVWCAEIDVIKYKDGDLWGRVHWSEKVCLLPEITCGPPEKRFYETVFYESMFPYSCEQLSVSL